MPSWLYLAPAAWAGRALTPEDWYRFKDVSDLTMAPDGKAVAYLVTTYDQASDQSRSALWLADWAGNGSVELTRGESVSEPRFSPDGRYISFLAARPADAATQLYLLDRRGGEPQQLTHVNGVITSYQWSPDGRRLVLVMHGSDADEPEARSGADARGGGDAPRPLVIDAFHFKQDKDGYLTAESRTHLCLLEVAGGACRALAADALRADSAPAFSPDSTQIAFVGNRDDSARQLGQDEILLVAAEPGAQPRGLLTTWSPNHQHLEWSPDGTLVAFLEGDEPRYNAYMMDRLALVEVSSGGVRQLTGSLDRAVLSPAFSADGQAIEFAVEDDGYQYPAQVALAGGALTRLAGPIVVEELAAAAGHTAVLSSTDRAPVEVYALEEGRLRPLSAHNQALFAELTLGSVEGITFKSPRRHADPRTADRKPPDFVRGRRYPDDRVDPRRTERSGRPLARARRLRATARAAAVRDPWLRGAGDQLSRRHRPRRAVCPQHRRPTGATRRSRICWRASTTRSRRASPIRSALGIGGWSYGGLLTDYTIATDRRFKAAIAGAGSGNQTLDVRQR